MPRKKVVKVRKWVTCAEPGCKRRARSGGVFCGEHDLEPKFKVAADKKRKAVKVARAGVKRFLETKEGRAAAWAAAKKGKAQPKKPAKQKSQKKITAAVKARMEADRVAELVRKRSKKEKEIADARRAASPSSRLIKAHCKKCGYTIRLTRKWIVIGRPQCPCCLKNMVTEIDGEKADPRQLKLKGSV